MNLVGRLRGGLRRAAQEWASRFDAINPQMLPDGGAGGRDTCLLDALEELLIETDVGVMAAGHIVTRIREANGDDGRELLSRIKAEFIRILAQPTLPAEHIPPPRVVMVVGVNGTGKTTTVGKLAHRWRTEGCTPLICAADTFRAAAVEQVEVWAARASVDIVRGRSGTDPAAVVFDAVQAGRARKSDVVLVDTAGRLHTRTDLMRELVKIRRVVAREIPAAPHDVLLVMDATVGQNGLSQARQFLKFAQVTGIVLTKLDGTAKGGVAVAIAWELGLPIRYIGFGEGINDLLPFSAENYVDALFDRYG